MNAKETKATIAEILERFRKLPPESQTKIIKLCEQHEKADCEQFNEQYESEE